MTKHLLTAARLLDCEAGEAIDKGAVLIEDGVIAGVGPQSAFSGISDCLVTDCGEQTLLPGLIDAHNHLSLDASLDSYLERMGDSLPALATRAARTIGADLDAGVTAVRCMGDKEYLDIEFRKALDSGYLEGPRLAVSGKGIRSSAGHGFVGYPCDGPEAIRRMVRANVAAGADIIKFYTTGTLRAGDEVICYLSPEEIGAVVDEAHRLGKPTAVHCIGGPAVDWCLQAGVDCLEHGYFLSDRDIENLLRNRVAIVLTPSFYMAEERIDALPRHLVAAHRAQSALARERMAAIVSSGLPYAAGTDGVHGPGALARELECLVELGARRWDALKSITVNAARLCGLAGLTGSLRKGSCADLIGVLGDPLQDLRALNQVKTVVSRGRIVRRA